MTVKRQDIARAAQVDPSVVSAVLNGSQSIRVSREKRELVLSLVKKMNYRPNITARSLSIRKSFSIGVLFNNTRDRFYAEMMAELQRDLTRRGYVGIYAFWNGEAEVTQAYDMVLSRKVDGIITCHNDTSLFPDNVPTVIYGMSDPGYDCILMDYLNSLRESLLYLMELGHRRIGYLGADENEPRYQYYRRLLDELDLEFNPEWIGHGFGFFGDSFDAAMATLKHRERPTAFICKNDMTAIGGLSAAEHLNIGVPSQLSIISFGNIEETRYTSPPLTTNGYGMDMLVRQLTDMLFGRMENPQLPPRKTLLKMKMIIRRSCAAPGS